MMTTETVPGRSTGGKPINLSQLEGEINAAGVALAGLGMVRDESNNGTIYRYSSEGTPEDFLLADQPTVDQCITEHVAMRPKTSAEYAAEFQDPNTTPARKQEIRDIQNGLLPYEQVPITQNEWDKHTEPNR